MNLRTEQEILTFYEKSHPLTKEFTGMDLLIYCSFASVKPYLLATVKESEYLELQKKHPYTREQIIQEIREYLPFAFNKAENQRSLSASRSIMHFSNWFWLLKEEEMFDFVNDDFNYAEYGLPILTKIQLWLRNAK